MLYILPTDTCYGIAGNFTQEDFAKIYELKGRDAAKKLAFLVRDFDELSQIAIISDEQKIFLKNYLHPFSVLLPPNPEYNFPDFLKIDNYPLISVRIWEIFLDEKILKNLHFPLFLTSANLSGQKEATTLQEANSIFPDIQGFDGGICNNPASNIFSFWKNNEINFMRKNY